MTTAFLTGLAAWYGLHVIYDCPIFLTAPPPWITLMRVRACLGLLPSTSNIDELRAYEMPMASRVAFLWRTIVGHLMLPLWDFLMLLDEMLYGREYRKVSVEDAVFVVGGFRTGSTSLHRALAMDEGRFTSPRFIELAFPFLIVQKYFDRIERQDKINGTQKIRNIEKKLQRKIGEDNMLRHPMKWYAPEEDDLLLAWWHKIGWYTGCTFPDPEAWIIAGQQTLHGEATQKRSYEFYKRSLQKFMYLRGDGRTLLSKNHMIDFLPRLAEELPNAKFVDIVRHPKDSFTSWYELAQGSLAVIACEPVEQKAMVQAHLRFWDKFTHQEKKFFIDDAGANCTIVSFGDYIKDEEGTVRKLYRQWGYRIEGTKLEERLVANRENHKKYKSKASYRNPTLEELGLGVDMMNDRYNDYTTAFKI